MKDWLRDNWMPLLFFVLIGACGLAFIITDARRPHDPNELRGGAVRVHRVRDEEERRTTCYVHDDGIFCLSDP